MALPLRVPYAGFLSVGLFSCSYASPVIPSVDRVDIDEHFASPLIEAVAAPRPVPGVFDETAFHGVRVHGLKLLDFLLPAPNIEVEESTLPKLRELFP